MSRFGFVVHSLSRVSYLERQSGVVLLQRSALKQSHSFRHGNAHVVPKRVFHTSQRRAIPPIFLMLIQPIGKIAAIVTGRYARRTWKGFSPETKAKVKAKVWDARWKIGTVGGLLFAAATVNFATHIQEAPITKRKRFIAFTQEQFLKIAQHEFEAQMEIYKEDIVPPSHPIYKKVINIAQNIVNQNQDFDFFRKQNWTVIVVNQDVENAFVLPTGHIFVFTGILKVAGGDDRLAMILGHEMAHAFLSHGAEQVSFAALLDWVIILVMAGIWAIMPSDGIALVTQWFYNKVMNIMLHLPYSRKLEEEADAVGLHLAAKACYDVRESSALWDLMDIRERLEPEVPPPEFLSTHPSNKMRAETLNRLIPVAMDIRTYCKCPDLPTKDPRTEICELRRLLEEDIKIKEQQEIEREEKRILQEKQAAIKSIPLPQVAGGLKAEKKS